jgi:hypothetical protein
MPDFSGTMPMAARLADDLFFARISDGWSLIYPRTEDGTTMAKPGSHMDTNVREFPKMPLQEFWRAFLCKHPTG